MRGPAKEPCKWVSLEDALERFALHSEGTQASEHIKRLHWYTACRLVLEGGFLPEEITPRPPFRVVRTPRSRKREAAAGSAGMRLVLEETQECPGAVSATVLGGLKTKSVDVVVAKPGIGPVLAISLKGTEKAFRNLTNRMEEAAGDCINLHIAYPALVYGFLHVLRANRAGTVPTADAALLADGTVADGIMRYHDVLCRLTGRRDLREDGSRYEAVALALIDPHPPHPGRVLEQFPPVGSALQLSTFFEQLYRQYDHRFVFGAPLLEGRTRRSEWDPDSPAIKARQLDYQLRSAAR